MNRTEASLARPFLHQIQELLWALNLAVPAESSPEFDEWYVSISRLTKSMLEASEDVA